MTKPNLRDPGTWVAVAFVTILLAPWAVAMPYFFYASTVKPVLRYVDTLSWREAPCSIVSSRIVPDGEEELYTTEVVFSYVVDGQVYRSDRGSFSGIRVYHPKETAQKAADLYPTGTRTICYYDPEEPSRAVLDPGISLGSFGLGLFFLLFAVATVGGLVVIYVRLWQARKRPPAPKVVPRVPDGPAPAELPASPPRLDRLIRHGFVALVWNAVVAAFVWQVIRNLRAERPVTWLAWLLLPFALAGMVLFYRAMRRFLGFFNPLPRLILSPGVAVRGEISDLQWWLSGDARKVRRLRIVLVGRKDPREEPFQEDVLLDTTEPFRIASGQVSFTLPLGAIPSVWKLRVATEVAAAPDLVDDFHVPMKLL